MIDSASNPCNQVESYPENDMIDTYQILSPLNSGLTSKVRLGRDVNDGTLVAIKIIKKAFVNKYLNDEEKIENFVQNANLSLDLHIVKRHNILPKAKYTKKNKRSKFVFAIILEYAEGGDLFETVMAIGNFKEEIARTYFHQLIETIEILHSKNISHRDLKPDNLLLGADFNLKLADFSLSSFIINQNNGNQRKEDHLSNNVCYAPEVFRGNISDSFALDIFSCGIILTIMALGISPFERAHQSDVRYKHIIKGQYEQFWKTIERNGIKLTSDFKSLINQMICDDPNNRASISDIKIHPWYTGDTYSVDKLKAEYLNKQKEIMEFKKKKMSEMIDSKEKKKNSKILSSLDSSLNPMGKLAFHAYNPICPKYRSINEMLHEKSNEKIKISLDNKKSSMHQNVGYRGVTEAIYTINAELLFKILIYLYEKAFTNFKVHEEKLKIKISVLSEAFSGILSMEVETIDDYMSCLKFIRHEGPINQYYKFVESLNFSINNFLDKELEE